MKEKKSIKLFSTELKPTHAGYEARGLFYVGRYAGMKVQIWRVPRPGPLGEGAHGQKCFEFRMDGAPLGRAMRPGEAAKRAEKFVTLLRVGVAREEREAASRG